MNLHTAPVNNISMTIMTLSLGCGDINWYCNWFLQYHKLLNYWNDVLRLEWYVSSSLCRVFGVVKMICIVFAAELNCNASVLQSVACAVQLLWCAVY